MELLDDSMNEVKQIPFDILSVRTLFFEMSKICSKYPECKEIYDITLEYLQENCLHSIVDDYIDVDYGERSIQISYCENCMLDISQLDSRTDLTVSTSGVCTTSS
jgi:hypothetical protein